MPPSFYHTCGIAVVVWLLMAACKPQAARSEVVIEGDSALIDVVRSAQATNRSNYPRGELEADVDSLVGTLQYTAHVTLIWDKGGTYWKYHQQEILKTREPSEQDGEIIEAESPAQIFYSPKARLLQVCAAKKLSYGDHLNLRPDRAWFGHRLLFDFDQMFDPAFNPVYTRRFVIRQEQQEIHVDRYFGDDDDAGCIRFVVSMDHGGNVIAFDSVDPQGSAAPWYRGRYGWAESAQGVWYVEKMKLERSTAGSPDEVDFSLDIAVVRFEPEPTIEPARFTRESLKIEPGTKVEEYDLSNKLARKYRYGQAEEYSQEQLEVLSSVLRGGRFAKGRN